MKTLRRTTLRFVVHNATKTLGQVSVSLKRLSHERREIVAPLKAHRKATTPPTGQLLYEAWLWNDASVTSSESAGAPSPLGKVKDALSHGVHLFIGNGTAAKTRSCDDLTHAADDTGRVFTYDNDGATTTPDDDDDIDDVFARRRNASSLGDLTACGGPPQITGVSPREGATAGGTALTIRGANLGTCKSDVTELAVCGVDCLNTLRYVSPTKLRCTTWRSGDACTGPITIATTSSGRGESLVNFSYVTLAALHCGGGANARGGGGGGGGGWYVSCDDIPSFVIDECPDADVDRTSVAASSAGEATSSASGLSQGYLGTNHKTAHQNCTLKNKPYIIFLPLKNIFRRVTVVVSNFRRITKRTFVRYLATLTVGYDTPSPAVRAGYDRPPLADKSNGM